MTACDESELYNPNDFLPGDGFMSKGFVNAWQLAPEEPKEK